MDIEKEALWEKQKRACLVRYIQKNREWGRSYIKKMEIKHGKEYAQKLNDERSKITGIVKQRENNNGNSKNNI